MRACARPTTLALALVCSPVVLAGPWAEPGDRALRQDIELLADSGVINIPITTWPLAWGDINDAVERASLGAKASPAVVRAFVRTQRRARGESVSGYGQTDVSLRLADNPRRLRTFENLPRANAEITGAMSYTGQRFAGRLAATLAANAEDDRSFRLDGSFVGLAVGNAILSVGSLDQWWGPGYDGALALSTNARPIPGFMVRRNFSTPFANRFLRHLGPWTANFFLGTLESGREVSDARFIGMRVTARPWSNVEIGLTRTAQWGGEGRPDDLDSFFDLLIGRDNAGSDGIDRSNEPGNQMAGYDVRWKMFGTERPFVGYLQLIGEDEAGGFPSRFLGQLGVSYATPVGRDGASLQTSVEFSDTTCQFYESSKRFNCAYQNTLYPSGYRYRDRPIGHSTDADSRQLSVSASLLTARDHRYGVRVRAGELNRGGGPDARHSLTATPSDLRSVDVSHERDAFDGRLSVGVGADRFSDGALDGTEFFAFVQWNKRL